MPWTVLQMYCFSTTTQFATSEPSCTLEFCCVASMACWKWTPSLMTMLWQQANSGSIATQDWRSQMQPAHAERVAHRKRSLPAAWFG